MELVLEFKKHSPLHHAYLLIGTPDILAEEVKDYLATTHLNNNFESHPDAWAEEHDVFGIAESRRIREWSTRRPVAGEKQYIVLNLNSATVEAQNALLKTLEEPVSTHFFLIMPSAASLIPTLVSRCFLIESKGEIASGTVALAREFLEAAPAARLKLTAALIARHETEGRQVVLNFLAALEKLLNDQVDKNYPALAELGRLRSYANDRSAAVRLILDHLVFVLPSI